MAADHTSIIFPHSTLTVLPNDRSPTPQDIQALRREVQENLMAIETPRGGGDHGFLAVCLELSVCFSDLELCCSSCVDRCEAWVGWGNEWNVIADNWILRRCDQ